MHWCVILGIVFLILIVFFLWKGSKRENFDPLGNLGKYEAHYIAALAECEREDPGKFYSPTKGNPNCFNFVNTGFTELARRGGPSMEGVRPISEKDLPPVRDSMTKTMNFCGADKECQAKYFCHEEVIEKCRQNCAYSFQGENQCMERCASKLGANCWSTSWTWK